MEAKTNKIFLKLLKLFYKKEEKSFKRKITSIKWLKTQIK